MTTVKLSEKNSYRQPFVEALAPDAVVFVEGKRTIKGQYVKDDRIVDTNIDFMNYVTTISVTKGIESVPGQASIQLNAPLHVFNQLINPTRHAFSTMQEVEIYMKGRFLYEGQAQYYPVFWGVISNISEGLPAGDFRKLTLTCQDMMRWLAITKVEISPSLINQAYANDGAGKMAAYANAQRGYAARYVNVSAMGIVRDIVNLSTSSSFLRSQGLITEGADAVIKEATAEELQKLYPNLTEHQQLMLIWSQKFEALASSLNIYGYQEEKTPVPVDAVADVLINDDAYKHIYGQTFFDKLLGEGSTSLFPSGALAFNTSISPTFESQFQNRLEVANEAKNQLHLEFYQDVDGTVVLKPPFYNMDTRENKIYVIDDLDITNVSLIDDESAVITRLDITGVNVNGQKAQTDQNKTQNYGYAIDFDKMLKYGFRTKSINTNFLTGKDSAKFYAEQELVRMNSLIKNGSVTIQGRPELKLGFPVYFSSREMYGYVTSIQHSFTFGGTFDTTISITAIRERKRDPLGEILKNLGVVIEGAESGQEDVQGEDSELDENQPFNSTADLCAEVDEHKVTRPFFRYKYLDDVLRRQGTFRFITNFPVDGSDDTKVQITDRDGWELIGGSHNYPFARDLKLTEKNLIELSEWAKASTTTDVSQDQRTTKDFAEVATSMELTSSEGARRTLSFQQPLTLDQIQSVEPRLNRSKSIIPMTMAPTDDKQETEINVTASHSNALNPFNFSYDFKLKTDEE